MFGIYFVEPCFVIDCECNSTNIEAAAQPQNDASTEISPSVSKVTGPILFSWNKEGAITGDGWNARRQAILDGLGPEEILEITGQYRADEINSSTFDNLGLARANDVANFFKPPLSDERIRLKGQLVKTLDADKTADFKSVAFRNLKNTNAIKEIDDRTLIYFPFNSVNRLEDPEIEAYLIDVVERIKRTGERVQLTGHTDNIDSEAFNQALGLKRANIVKQFLLEKGVDPSKIIVLSKGETKPIASNSTSEGRAENRRTELRIIK